MTSPLNASSTSQSTFHTHLNGYRLNASNTDKCGTPSHTTFGKVTGTYKVPISTQDEFLECYASETLRLRLTNRTRDGICVVERHRDFGPVVIDLDFRYDVPVSGLVARKHGPVEIDAFIKEYFKVLSTWVVLPSTGVHVYIMERPSPRVEKGIIKDGVHIIIPDVVTECKIQTCIRREALSNCTEALSTLNLKNGIDDVFDEAVIERNGWILLGSSKPGTVAYEITRVCNVKVGPDGVSRTNLPFVTPEDEHGFTELVKTLSIRRSGESNALVVHTARQSEIAKIKEIEARTASIKQSHPDLSVTVCGSTTRCCSSDFELAKKLVRILSDLRADNYQEWLQVGWCLHNLDDRLLPEWVEFSRRSSKFEEGYCENLWNSFIIRSERPLKLGSLKKWAQTDSPSEYTAINREQHVGYIKSAISGLHHDVALATYNVFMDEFVCSSVKNNTWYRFFNHRWRPCDSGTVLRVMLSTEIYNLFKEEANKAKRIADMAGGDPDHPQALIAKKMNDNADKLKTSCFKDAVMRELKDHFYKENFENMLDEKTTLIGFENGVYDLDTREFRKGAPEDMLTFSTRINYIEFDPSDPVYESIFSFFNSVQPDNDLRTYLLKFLASCLNGTVREHSFHIAQGIGSNGKSLTIEFFEKAFGDYAVKLPVAFLTQKRGHSGAANPEVIRLKGKRFACLQEPGNDERLNVGLMKEVTGGDTIVARGLYKDCIEIKPQFRLVLTANNLPEVPSADGGTWRRIKLLPFGSRFVENPNPDKPNEFQIDYDLSGKLGKVAPYFLSYLIELYYDYKETGNPPPAQVTAATEQYKRMSDHFQTFVEKFIEMDSDSSIVIDDLFELYKDFMMDQNKGARVKRQDFILNIKTVLRFEGNDYDTGYGGKIKKFVNKEPGFVNE